MSLNASQPGNGQIESKSQEIPFTLFLKGFKSTLKNAFHNNGDIDRLSVQRRLPPQVLNEIMWYNPLSICIPREFGGRGAPIHENLALMSAAAYESLALSLTLSISYALFIQPVTKYGQDAIKAPVFKRFIQDYSMGGLMITEPGHGSDALNMETFYTEQNGSYHIEGKKHWGGLTGMADFWLLAARRRLNDELMRDIEFFICDVSSPQQSIVVEEYFENLGLYQIPYGRNNINVTVPALQRLEPHSSGIKMMIDILHRSRIQFPGMGVGFIKRMLDEAIKHTQQRMVGNRELRSYDQVQHRLARLQADFTICSALLIMGSELADLNRDLTPLGLEANIIKSITTDLMQEASQSLLQLVGADGYRLNHIAGRSVVDSRPFQIFEGSNDILYVQISETFLKLMNKAKENNFLQFLAGFPNTSRAADYFREILDFELEKRLPQRKLVELGRIISRIAAMDYVIKVSDRGFRPDLIDGSLSMLRHEITALLSAYSYPQKTTVINDYNEGSFWLDFVNEK